MRKTGQRSPGKVRKNLTLSADTIDQTKAIQKAEQRNSFSNTLEAVVGREFERLMNPDKHNGHKAVAA